MWRAEQAHLKRLPCNGDSHLSMTSVADRSSAHSPNPGRPPVTVKGAGHWPQHRSVEAGDAPDLTGLHGPDTARSAVCCRTNGTPPGPVPPPAPGPWKPSLLAGFRPREGRRPFPAPGPPPPGPRGVALAQPWAPARASAPVTPRSLARRNEGTGTASREKEVALMSLDGQCGTSRPNLGGPG